MRRLLTSLLVTGAALARPLAAPPDTTPFDAGRHGEIIVPVAVGDRGLARFILDTGSSHSVVSTSFAQSIGAVPVARTAVTLATGATESRTVVRIDGLAVGPTCADNVLASVVPANVLGAGVDGLLGQDVLAGRAYTIDYRRHLIAWRDPADTAPVPGVAVALRAEDGRYLVDLPQRQTVLHLVPDSGAEALVLFQPVSLGLPLRAEGVAGISTLADAVDAPRATLFELRVGGVVIRDVPAVLLGRRPAERGANDGLLPLALFSRVTFDAPGRQLIVEAR